MIRSISRNLWSILALIAITAAPGVHAAEETRDLEDFDSVSFLLPYEVEFVQTDEPFITFEGDEDVIDEIITRIKGGTLKVYRKESWFNWSSGDVVVTLGYTTLKALTMAGSGDGYAKSIDAETFTLNITGSANMEVDSLRADELKISVAGSGNALVNELDADSVDAKIAGSGDIELAGRVNSQQISISGSGDHDAAALRTQETTASVRGSGDIEVWAEARLAASLVGSGDVRYYGDPDVKEKIVGSGTMVRLGEEP